MLQITNKMNTMKRFIKYSLLVLLALSSIVCCTFDDSSIQSRLDEIKNRIAALQSRIDEANAQVESLGLLTSGNVITSIDKNADGSYVLTYLDAAGEEKTLVAAATDQLINVPVVGVRKDDNGLYYWTVTVGETTTDILIDGAPVPVAGKTPKVSVDAEGYWTVDGERILNAAGNPIEAADGSSTIFKEIAKDSDGNLAITLGNGSKVTIPVQNSLNLTLSSSVNITVANLSATQTIGYEVSGSSAENAIVAIAEAKNIKATLDKEQNEVSVSFSDAFTSGHLIMMATDLDRNTVLRPVFFEKAKETKINITTAAELVAFANRVNAQDGAETMEVYLDKDIDMSSESNWTPIGNGTFSGSAVAGASFKGTFYGQNHTVKGLKMSIGSDAESGAVTGLFGILQGATVKDVTVGEGSTVTSSSAELACAGGIAGAVVNSTVEHCFNYAAFNISGGKDNISQRFGGIAGSLYSDGETLSKISNCTNYGKFSSVNTVNTKNGGTAFSEGGVVGFAESANSALRVRITSCDNYGEMNVQASRNAGVVATLNKNATAEKCTNYANITNTDTKASNTRVAGVVSGMGSQTSVLNCVNKGNITFAVAGNTTQGYAGGVVGQTNDNSNVVSYCENYGSVRSDIFNATDATKRFISIIVGNTNNKTCIITNNKVGGKIGPYSDDSAVVTITAENFSSYVYFTPKTAPSATVGNEFAGEILSKGIASAQDLVEFAAAVNAGESTEKWQDEAGGVNLLNDIDMTSVTDWTPIGNGTYSVASNVITVTGAQFTGKFNGQGYKIRNFKAVDASSTAGSTFGLFGIVGSGATVENFTFESSCSLTVTATAKNTASGLIAGLVLDGTVRDVHSYAPMTFKGKTGANNSAQFMALIGYAFTEKSAVTIDSIDNYGEITAENADNNQQGGASAQHIAGIVGFSSSDASATTFVTISDCSNSGNMTSATCRTSGICAAANRSTNLVNCVNRGNQLNSCPGSDKGRLGNITCNTGTGSSASGCINYGDLISTSSSRIGGITSLSNTATFTGCANYGKIQSDNKYRGVFWGYNNGAATWNNCTAGGTVGTYAKGEGVDDVYTEDTKINYLGQQGSTKSILDNITYLIGTKDADPEPESNAKLKILFIGNSFTKDAVEHLPGMLAAAGITDIKLCHMYYGGRRVCEYNDGYSTSVDYHCYRCENGATTWTDVTGKSLHEVVSSDKWDIVTIQEHTGRAVAWSWTDSQKTAFQGLVDKVKADCTEKTPQFYFIMSQAYYNLAKIASSDQSAETFTDTEGMYNTIVSMTKSLMADITDFKDVVATGTCLQNLRTSSLNNSMQLTRDGYHMDYGISRYAAACMVFEKLISPTFDNVKLDSNSYRYTTSSTTDGSYSTPVTDANAPVALKAARAALTTPYAVTNIE